MTRVTGIGGFFFRAQDPDALSRWYADHFGVVMLDSKGYEDPGWFQDRAGCSSRATSWTRACATRRTSPTPTATT